MPSALSAEHFQTEEAAFAYVEAKLWPNGPTCPHCGVVGQSGRLQGKTTRVGLRKCYACRKPFTVRMGTVFESSHVPLRVWLQVVYLLCSSKKGISTRQIHRTIGGSMKTAWFLTHRIREMMKEGTPTAGVPPMGGDGQTVEADETYIGIKKGFRKGHGAAHKMAVIALVERGGRARSFHVPRVSSGEVLPLLRGHIAKESRLVTDESGLYRNMYRAFASHETVNHGREEYVRGDVYTNTVEGFFSVFKRGMRGVYQHCSEDHLQRYLTEFNFRHNNRIRLGVDDQTRTENAIKGAAGRRLTYQTTREGGAPEFAPF
jgi:transposase-like protein